MLKLQNAQEQDHNVSNNLTFFVQRLQTFLKIFVMF